MCGINKNKATRWVLIFLKHIRKRNLKQLKQVQSKLSSWIRSPPPRSTVRLRRLDSHSSFRSSRGRKSERKSEHMTLLKDTPQLAFCIGFAWQTPGAERSFLYGRGCHGMTDSSKSSKEKKSPPKKAPIEKTLYFHHLWFRFGNLEEFCIKKRLISKSYLNDDLLHEVIILERFANSKLKCTFGLTFFFGLFLTCLVDGGHIMKKIKLKNVFLSIKIEQTMIGVGFCCAVKLCILLTAQSLTPTI